MAGLSGRAGGGQPHDVGRLTWDGGSIAVVEVRKQGSTVLHRVEGAPFGTRGGLVAYG